MSEGPAEKPDADQPGAGAPPGAPLPDVSACQPAVQGQLAEYQLLEKLGRGGMGVVYKARHTELDRLVAVKVLAVGQMDDQQAVARFKREIKAVGKLDHPNIVRAFDARESDGTHFLVMELVAGADLAQLVHRLGPLPIADACELVRQAALGLDAAYQQGLIHRDIKPSNLMVDRSGVVKLLDLGLARFRSMPAVDGQMTFSGQALGTPDYMAPEQVQDSRTADIRADLYSLGCTLYHLLTGAPPFSGAAYRTAFDKMTAHVRDPAAPVAHFRPEVPKRLSHVLDKLLAKQADQRYATPAELADVLAPLAAGSDLPALVADAEGRSATPPPRHDATRAAPPVALRRRHLLAWIAAALLGALAAGTLALTVGYRLARRTDDGHSGRSTPSGTVPEQPARRQPDGWIVMSWTLPGTGKPDLWLLRPDGSQRLPITDDPESSDVHPSFAPDGRRIAFVRSAAAGRSTSLWVVNADGSEPREVVRPGAPGERLLSPVWLSNATICYTRDPVLDRRPDMEVWQIDVAHGRPERMFRFADTAAGQNGVVTDASPDGARLAVIAQTGWAWPMSNVYLMDPEGNLLQTLWQDDPDDRKDARALWSDDGACIAWHHNFTRGALAEAYYYGVGMAHRTQQGAWQARLQSNRELRITPLAWAPGRAELLCAQFASGSSDVKLVLMDTQLRVVRELFRLQQHAWQPGQRDFGRLADWAIVPDDVPLPVGSG